MCDKMEFIVQNYGSGMSDGGTIASGTVGVIFRRATLCMGVSKFIATIHHEGAAWEMRASSAEVRVFHEPGLCRAWISGDW